MARKTKQQAEETRQQILDAAVREFSAHGVSGTSLTDIAAAAGVTRGAIYWHFKNKVDLFNEIWELSESKIDQLESEYQAKYPDNPLRILREILIYVLVSTQVDCRRRALMEIVFHKCEFVGEMSSVHDARKVLDLASYDRIESVLKGCVDAQQLPANLDTYRAAIIMRAYITGLMENWLFMPESFDIKQEAPILIDAYLDMLVHSPSLLKKAE
ncbi:multidrug efflux transporter transcriptional repressor AcrR [Yersinia massiliensis]|jgi:TetR/AcrR family acrAB operon transcriptional repressor|uniref:DNA-binding transcriptional repressor AcrR n=3 Tax=Yersinia TaxID=629 RepID=A0A0T9PIS8_9GAMM|nr:MULTISPECIES: multidrug efflux transporter transcriptional repressor AcrR [Yersinia]HEC1651415.1 multidrug efflux transporter transcriptional repressor AcrR [Yersinia enterocolitica]ATM84944.1 DNA-binding transcriptional repressor AcrR [Yersinia frederiksenii]AVX39172.1 DNA-binding transcriptional repressor AcrR [Yersinia massiliensis]MCB5307746.1 multidrug efflux transporter transcriptional repressor AcrR [Yersinia massiliensis]MCB5319067.1 multidrug efflux transporter transcriptional repr